MPPASPADAAMAARPLSLPRRLRRNRLLGRWTLAWAGATSLGIANAGVRELVYADRVGTLAAYNLAAGRVWVLVPLWMAFGPAAVHQLRIRREPHGRAGGFRGLHGRSTGEVPARRPGVGAVTLAVPVGMRVVFGVLARRLGARRGYLAGFACYWTGCYLLPAALLGRRQVAELLRRPAGPLPRPRWLAALALLVPPLGAAGTQLLPALGQADPAQLATAGALAAVNATGEELLWRGLFVVGFPDDPVRGWLWPAAGFTAWHLAPTSVRPARQPVAFVAGSALIGVGMGWIAWRTRSLRWTLPAHLATDANGLSAARFWLGRSD